MFSSVAVTVAVNINYPESGYVVLHFQDPYFGQSFQSSHLFWVRLLPDFLLYYTKKTTFPKLKMSFF